MHISEIEAKSILVKSRLPDADYVVNPYTGCIFGCAYCYASFMGRFVDQPIEAWGEYLYVKKNAVAIFEREIGRLTPERRRASLLLSSVTDPYQGAEKDYRLTRGVLEVLARVSYPGLVSILTKSPMVLRDCDLLRQLPKVEVGLTVTTTDDRLGRFLEVRAPLVGRRLETLHALREAGLPTYAFVGPLLPHFRYAPDLLDELFASLAAAGVGSVFVEHINLKPYIRKRLWENLADSPPEVRAIYAESTTEHHRQILQEMVLERIARYGLKLRLGQVIYHQQPPAESS